MTKPPNDNTTTTVTVKVRVSTRRLRLCLWAFGPVVRAAAWICRRGITYRYGRRKWRSGFNLSVTLTPTGTTHHG